MMKVTVELDIADCNDCPFKEVLYEGSSAFLYCNHPNWVSFPKDGYLEDASIIPEWCLLTQITEKPELGNN